MYISFSVKDCGLFAIAFALEVAYGGNRAVVSYQQTEMRKHLVSCFDKGELQLFPRANKAASVYAVAKYLRCTSVVYLNIIQYV